MFADSGNANPEQLGHCLLRRPNGLSLSIGKDLNLDVSVLRKVKQEILNLFYLVHIVTVSFEQIYNIISILYLKIERFECDLVVLVLEGDIHHIPDTAERLREMVACVDVTA